MGKGLGPVISPVDADVEFLSGVAPSKASASDSEPDLWLLAIDATRWDRATIEDYNSLSSIDNGQSYSVTDLVQRVDTLAREQFQTSCARTTTEQKSVAVLPSTQKFINRILDMKSTIDATLRLDVSGYGATAWSIISFGFQV